MRSFSSLFRLIFVFSATLPIGVAHATSMNSCSDVIDTGSCDAKNAGDQSFYMKAEHCTAACQADKASSSSQLQGFAWLVPVAVCTTACLPGNLVSEGLCNWAFYVTMGAEVLYALFQKQGGEQNAASLLTNLGMTVGGGLLTDKLLSSGDTVSHGSQTLAEKSTISKDQLTNLTGSVQDNPSWFSKLKLAACAKAGLAAIKSGTSFASAGSSNSLRDEQLKTAGSLTSEGGDSLPVPESTSESGNTTSHVLASTSGSNGNTSSGTTHGSCMEQFRIGIIQDYIKCMNPKDPNYKAMTDPRFKDAFKQATNKDLSDFMRSLLNHPPKSVGDAVASSLSGISSLDSGKVASAFNKTNEKYRASLEGSEGSGGNSYAGGSRSSPQAESTNPSIDFQSFMSKMMEGMNGKPGEGDKPLNLGASGAPSTRQRSVKEIEEDRDLSLFSRVENRYRLHWEQVTRMPASSR